MQVSNGEVKGILRKECISVLEEYTALDERRARRKRRLPVRFDEAIQVREFDRVVGVQRRIGDCSLFGVGFALALDWTFVEREGVLADRMTAGSGIVVSFDTAEQRLARLLETTSYSEKELYEQEHGANDLLRDEHMEEWNRTVGEFSVVLAKFAEIVRQRRMRKRSLTGCKVDEAVSESKLKSTSVWRNSVRRICLSILSLILLITGLFVLRRVSLEVVAVGVKQHSVVYDEPEQVPQVALAIRQGTPLTVSFRPVNAFASRPVQRGLPPRIHAQDKALVLRVNQNQGFGAENSKVEQDLMSVCVPQFLDAPQLHMMIFPSPSQQDKTMVIPQAESDMAGSIALIGANHQSFKATYEMKKLQRQFGSVATANGIAETVRNSYTAVSRFSSLHSATVIAPQRSVFYDEPSQALRVPLTRSRESMSVAVLRPVNAYFLFRPWRRGLRRSLVQVKALIVRQDTCVSVYKYQGTDVLFQKAAEQGWLQVYASDCEDEHSLQPFLRPPPHRDKYLEVWRVFSIIAGSKALIGAYQKVLFPRFTPGPRPPPLRDK
jgi:hypothetical protein